jgi:hypothetical protein
MSSRNLKWLMKIESEKARGSFLWLTFGYGIPVRVLKVPEGMIYV